MRRKVVVIATALLLLLTSCGETEETVEVVEPSYADCYADYTYDDIGIKAIGENCGFKTTDTGIEIYPLNKCPKHISIEKILLSDNPFWDAVLTSKEETSVVMRGKNFSYFTDADGRTMGCYTVGDYGYIFSSDDLPSTYVKAVLNRVWIINS